MSDQQLSDAIALLAKALSLLPGAVNDTKLLTEIKTRQDIFLDEFREERENARLYRSSVRDTITAQGEATRNLERSMTELKPIVDDYRTNKYRGQGVVWFVRWVWGGVAALVGAAGMLIGMKLGR